MKTEESSIRKTQITDNSSGTMGKLYFTYSAMNAGKSAILLQAAHNYGERGMQVMLWTSEHHATEPGATMGKIASRIGLHASAHIFRECTDMFSEISNYRDAHGLDAVFIDEAQFLSSKQIWALARVGDELNIPVLCYGLRTDFQGNLFEGSAELLAIADDLREARTICHCGRKATMNLRIDDDGATVTTGRQVGVTKSSYISLCRRHWLERFHGASDDLSEVADSERAFVKDPQS